jgi:N-acetylmuramoyl-L-alanine amidase
MDRLDALIDFKRLSEQELLARCIYGEARGESELGKIAVAHVVMNRVKGRAWFGKTVHGVILKPFQFSCFNHDDPNCRVLSEPEIINRSMLECQRVADDALAGKSVDPTAGSTHYYSGDKEPRWVKDKGMSFQVKIGCHKFFMEKQ